MKGWKIEQKKMNYNIILHVINLDQFLCQNATPLFCNHGMPSEQKVAVGYIN